MSLISEAWQYAVTELQAAGLTVVDDPRNIQPPCCIVDLPSFVAISANLVQCDIPATLVAPPPGNKDSATWLVDMADTVLQALSCTGGQPASYAAGAADLPAYTVTLRLTLQRTP